MLGMTATSSLHGFAPPPGPWTQRGGLKGPKPLGSETPSWGRLHGGARQGPLQSGQRPLLQGQRRLVLAQSREHQKVKEGPQNLRGRGGGFRK